MHFKESGDVWAFYALGTVRAREVVLDCGARLSLRCGPRFCLPDQAMKIGLWVALGAAIAVAAAGVEAKGTKAVDSDPYLWLSDIHGTKALAWVERQNAKSE